MEIKNPFNLKKMVDDKESILDIKATDENGKIFNIEMQTTSDETFRTRSIYYWARLYSSQLHKGDKYKRLFPVICINILEFEMFNQFEKYHSTFVLMDRQLPNFILTDHLSIHFLEPPKVRTFLMEKEQHIDKKLEKWRYYLKKDGLAKVIMKNKIQVLIVDDSALVRQALSDVLSSDPEIEVMATASDPYVAASKMRTQIPDVITLDVEMPRMDGITFLQKIMSQHPIPVVICSSLAGEGSATAFKALEYGAVDIIQKPSMGTKKFIEESRIKICDTIKAAALSKAKKISEFRKVPPKLTADAVIAKSTSRAMVETTDKIVAVGASTGGTEALRVLLEALPPDSPGIVVVQHMPEHFTRAFAKRLDGLCQVSVKEAVNNDPVLPGQVLIAPGNDHMLLKRSGARYYVEVKSGPLVSRHRPSVDVLFRSTARYAGQNAIGVIMTGMGDDGAQGMLEMKEAGAFTIAQDEKSCVVFGMPNEAIKKNAVDKILPLEAIARTLLQKCNKSQT